MNNETDKKIDRIYTWLTGLDGKDGFIDRYPQDIKEIKKNTTEAKWEISEIKTVMVTRKECNDYRNGGVKNKHWIIGLTATIILASPGIILGIMKLIELIK